MFVYLDSAMAVALRIGQVTALSFATSQAVAPAPSHAPGFVPVETRGALPSDDYPLRASPFRSTTK
ncbi:MULTISPECIES: hypothetical protein [Caballeronia]|jgi:hypothetical protein|uniref:Uncharacterized protein n=2 Tax=Caballeronia TaxID=1827195 RepID=A0A656QNC3_9BURK|nr:MULTISPECIES: hypothetical protein [Caballeronia]KDR30464.1 hypothetical protein BG60_37940 [Caballeronia zhejiangensis]MDR5789687.1 hypothetical protein [Caballeronia sp. LP003]